MRFRITGLVLLGLAVTAATLVATLPTQANPQHTGKITGKVIDQRTNEPVAFANVWLDSTSLSARTDEHGNFTITNVPPGLYSVRVTRTGYATVQQASVVVMAGQTLQLAFSLKELPLEADTVAIALPVTTVADVLNREEGFVKQGEQMHVAGGRSGEVHTIVDGVRVGNPAESSADQAAPSGADAALNVQRYRVAAKCQAIAPGYIPGVNIATGPWNTEEYALVSENQFLEVLQNPLSTFSIDVDAASYSNTRRFINAGQIPPKDAVRIEELVNYFVYDYPQPEEQHPFAIVTEMSECPWKPEHRLVHIGLQGRTIDTENLPPSNLVFLLDVSGSMQPANKLPLLKSAFRLLVDQLRPEDRVAIVVYAGAAGLVLPSTPGTDKESILAALDNLRAGGTTAGAQGIRLAYQVAQENFQKEGNNRVILATDGDFNVGTSSTSELVRMIEAKREAGVFLTVLGFGTGNVKDGRMEQLADKGNGNYAYIDNLREARKVLVSEMGGTLFTIAKDVKIQIEFNPAHVQAYRLVGYENRLLAKEDFNDDTKDAGELGAGHTVTAMYELVPADADFVAPAVDSLKYQIVGVNPDALTSDEVMTVKLRYKEPAGHTSKLITRPLPATGLALAASSDNFRFAAAVAQFGMLLRNSEFKGNTTYDRIVALGSAAMGTDAEGYRHEFVSLVRSAQMIDMARAER